MSRVKLVSSDNVPFEVDLPVMQEAKLVIETVESTQDHIVFLPNIPSKILVKVIRYCTYHRQSNAATEEEIKQWDAAFVEVDHPTLLGLIDAAAYMDLRPLLNLMCQRAADLIHGKTVEEIRRTFGIVSDFTAKEEKANAARLKWFFKRQY